MKKETINKAKIKEYLEDEKVKRNLDLYNNHKEEFVKEANELRNGSFISLMKDIIKNKKEYKKKKKHHKALKTK